MPEELPRSPKAPVDLMLWHDAVSPGTNVCRVFSYRKFGDPRRTADFTILKASLMEIDLGSMSVLEVRVYSYYLAIQWIGGRELTSTLEAGILAALGAYVDGAVLRVSCIDNRAHLEELNRRLHADPNMRHIDWTLGRQ